MNSWVLIAVALAADPHQGARSAEIEMAKCFFVKAAALDDHASEASTIAQGVVRACHPEIEDWKYAYFVEYRPPAATLFYKRLDRVAASQATEVVLRVRVATNH